MLFSTIKPGILRYTVVLLLLAATASQAQFRDTTAPEPDTASFQMQKSPWLAVGLSAILPGAGQIYLDQWYKAPFIWGGIGACLAGAFIQNNRYHYTADSVRKQLARGDTALSYRYASAREFYRDDRDKFYIYAAIFYIANLLDAYIAAHLYDFDVSDPGPAPYLMMPQSLEEPWRVGMRGTF